MFLYSRSCLGLSGVGGRGSVSISITFSLMIIQDLLIFVNVHLVLRIFVSRAGWEGW